MKLKFLSVVGIIVALWAGASAFGGDILEIRPTGIGTDGQYVSIDYPVANIDAPLTNAGTTIRFTVRLVTRTANPSEDRKYDYQLRYKGSLDPTVAEYLNPLQLGIYVSGRLEFANLVGEPIPRGKCYSDLVFEYTTKSGDFALPICLASPNGPIRSSGEVVTDMEEQPEYLFQNTHLWDVVYHDEEAATNKACAFQFATSVPTGRDPYPDGEPLMDYSLEQAGFYVQTLGFNPEWEKPGEYWRSVPQGSFGKASLASLAPVEDESVTLHVWSDDDSAVRIRGGQEIHLRTGTDMEGNPIYAEEATRMGTVTIVRGAVSADFEIEGVTSNKTANLVLSAWENYSFKTTTSDKIRDYVTVPVYCSAPLPPTLELTFEDGSISKTVNASTNVADEIYEKDVVTLRLSHSEPFASNTVITIAVRYGDADVVDPYANNYVAIAKQNLASSYQVFETNVTIEAGATEDTLLYVYPLGGDANTASGGITFRPEFMSVAPQDAERYSQPRGCTLRIKDVKPTIISPTSADALSGDVKIGCQIPIEVLDCYRDLSSICTYQVDVTFSDGSTFTTNNVAFRRDTPAVIMASGFGTKATWAKVKVTDPQGSTALSEQIPMSVPAAKTVRAELVATKSETAEALDDLSFKEGDSIYLRFALGPDETASSPVDMYAFLIPLNAASSNLVSTSATSEGVLIPADSLVSKVPANAALTFLDGCAAAEDLRFGIMLRNDGAGITNGSEIVNYMAQTLYVTAVNVAPVVTDAKFNNGPVADRGMASSQAPAGSGVNLSATVDDIDLDLFGTNEADRVVVRWTISEGPGDNLNYEVYYTTNSALNATVMLQHVFNTPGTTQTVSIAAQDKDMRARNQWGKEYSFRVRVNEAPYVIIESPTGADLSKESVVFDEKNDERTLQYLVVRLSAAPTGITAADPLVVKLDIEKQGDGACEFDTRYLTFTATKTQNRVFFTGLDGEFNSTFYMSAMVTNITKNAYGGRWCDYYAPGEGMFSVMDVAPTISGLAGAGLDMTNNATLGTAKSLKVTASDISIDLTSPEFKVSWTDSTGTEYVTPAEDITYSAAGGITNSISAPFTYTPNVEGYSYVTVTVNDGDGKSDSRRIWFYVAPTKKIEITPFGPAEASSTLSKYGEAEGLGKGRVWATGDRATVTSFRHTWYADVKTTQMGVYAYGYPAAADEAGLADDGTLADSFGETDRDLSINRSGRNDGTEITSFYRYGRDWTTVEDEWKYDNFFYCWFDASEVPTLSDKLNGVPKPSVDPKAEAYALVKLDPYEKDKETYETKAIEAIFSRERYPEDNLGDINADDIPDVFALKTWSAGNLVELMHGKDKIEGDLLKVDQYNGDEDYLPGVYEQEGVAPLVDGSKNSYAPIGIPFDARFELRGFGDGLNALDVTTSDPSFNETEQKAWKAYVAAWNATHEDDKLDESAPDLNVWSPEPKGEKARLDPTIPDTDDDTLPDGWEYYFWYKAHVEVPAGAKPRDGDVAVFEKFNVYDILTGIPIDPKEVEEFFNPLTKRTREQFKDRPDFDGDGLSDKEELLIGTNPCHWDTDGDHMCDGWEVMMCLDPLNGGDKGGNPDGDFCAQFSPSDYIAWRAPTNLGTGGFDVKPDDVYAIDLSGQYLGGDGFGIYWDMATPAEYDDDGNLVALPTYVAIRDFTARLFWFKAFQDPHSDPMGPDGPQAYRYGRPGDMPKDPLENPNSKWGYFMAKEYGLSEIEVHAGDPLVMPLFVFMHDQVRDIFGFDPRTGWYKDSNGYVASRWDPTVNEDLMGVDATGVAVNTVPYCTYDEYLVMRFRTDLNKVYPFPPDGEPSLPNPDKPWETLRALTTNPSVPVSVTETAEDVVTYEVDPETGVTNEVHTTVPVVSTNETSTSGIAAAVAAAFLNAGSDKSPVVNHGADTDGDGVPDGWELYVFRDPGKGAGTEENPLLPFLGPMLDQDLGDDGLTYAMEFAGTDSCNAYKGCPSIYKNHPGNRSGWFNKFFPTNPGFQKDDKPDFPNGGTDADHDTDGDGIPDSVEGEAWSGSFPNGNASYIFAPSDPGFTFVYGDPVDDNSACIRGGGLNPLNCDTDLDGLPDPWERDYAGVPVNAKTKKYVGPAKKTIPEIVDETFIADRIFTEGPDVVYIAGGMDGTWGGDGFTDPLLDEEGSNSADPLLGITHARDVDFDHDGLQNYQEYLVQQMRHFRYDDITTPLMGRVLEEGTYMGMSLLSNHKQNFMGFVPMMQDAGEFCASAAARWYGSGVLETLTTTNRMVISENPITHAVVTNYITTVTTNVGAAATVVRNRQTTVGMFRYPWIPAAWEALGYMTMAPHAWDRSILWSGGMIIRYFMYPGCGGSYASTDPRLADTDMDGMDDYYELFHGLNPILGSTVVGSPRDIIAQAYGSPDTYNAFWNEWTHPDFNRINAMMGMPGSSNPALTPPAALDPVLYPWAMGAMEADSDGDGLRNGDEAILANVTGPAASHTDPSPLWFTDSSSPKSYVQQYYSLSQPVKTCPFWPMMIGYENTYSVPSVEGGVYQYTYAFEENEGYDTDGDWVPDGREIVKTTKIMSDPLKFTDPVRRQAAWFDGVDSFMMTKETQYRGVDAVDLLKQFTVECWVRPEESGREQTIIERSTYYGGDAVTKLGGVVRANFRIGLTATGEVYGLFDNSDAIESGTGAPVSCQRVTGNTLPLGEWTHVALTYDGKELVLYENGKVVSRAATSLIPANGILWIGQTPASVQPAPAFPASEYEFTPLAFFIGARPQHFAGAAYAGSRFIPLYPWYLQGGVHCESFANYREYFKGWVDEVRVWDGARSAADILANYAKAMSFDEVAANREEIYQSWAAGGTRNENDGLPMLPPELVQHYSFTEMPGAVDSANVAKVPVGFDQNVDAAAQNGYSPVEDNPDFGAQYYDIAGFKGVPGSTELTNGIKVAWWDECLIRSQVYDDTRVLPWIQNTVAHLPVMDGSCVDSELYSDSLGGHYTPASAHGLSKFAFPNTAMPYQYQVFFLERYNHLFCLDVLTNQLGSTYLPILNRYEFEIRSHFVGTSDLLPMGHAYAKTCSALWDGAAADSWEYSGTDSDADGLPDWWERYARDNYLPEAGTKLNWDTIVDYHGVRMSAYQAYLIDLARGMQPDGEYHPEYAATIDADNDGLPDWWEDMFGVGAYGAADDPDHDGLSNYAEWRISFGPDPFGVENGWPFLDPTLSHTDPQQRQTDYFLQPLNIAGLADHYLGEIVTDHDFMEDPDEEANGTDRTKYDAYSDFDEDGWSAWSEMRYSAFKASILARLVSHFAGDSELLDSPMPTLRTTVRYNGTKVATGATTPIVIQAYSGNNLQKKPTAKYVINPGTPVERTCYIGSCAEPHIVHGTLSPGFTQAGLDNISIQFSFIQPNDNFTWSVKAAGEETGTLGYGTWAEMYAAYQEAMIAGSEFDLKTQGMAWTDLLDPEGKNNSLQVSVDEATQKGHLLFMHRRVGEIDLQTGDFDFDTTECQNWLFRDSSVALVQCVARIRYHAMVPALQNKALSLSLTKPDEGQLKEGSTAFVAFFDLDGNGELDPETEPVGFVRDIDVGWDRVPDLTIEMTDTAAGALRFAYGDDVETLRIIRTSVNGETEGVKRRIVYSRTASDVTRKNVYDGDLISSGKFGLDWSALRADIDAMDGVSAKEVKSVGYAVVSGAGSVLNLDPASILKEFEIEYAADATPPTCVSPSPKAYRFVDTSRPVFKWTASDGYTAFRLQIADTAGAIVYASDLAALPPRNGSLQYVWTAPVYVGTNVLGDAWALDNNTSYKWRVAMYNAKFSNTNDAVSAWSEWTDFATKAAAKNDSTTSYGCADVTVNYFGPATNTLDQVIVQLFRNADFSGRPVAQTRLYDVAGGVTNLASAAQTVRFVGLESGDYYAAAFVDRNGNAKRDRYEIWGYACKVDYSQNDIYTPVEATVDAKGTKIPVAVVFMEDTDVNQSEILDYLEDVSILADASASAAGADTTDVDGDGLTGDEETSDTYTDSQKWDTDGDGMPDGWEAKFADTDPLDSDAETVLEGDTMAYFTESRMLVSDSDGHEYLLAEDMEIRRGDKIPYSALMTKYDYPVLVGSGTNAVLTTYVGVGTNLVDNGTTFQVDSIRPTTAVLVHAQVYDRFGFSQKTAIPQDGSVNTKPFTALDKYLVVRYLEAIGFAGVSEAAMNTAGAWRNFTLKPGDSDNDRDGLADGWELYVMFGTNTTAFAAGQPLSAAPISPWAYADRDGAFDGDTLSNVDEYCDGKDPSDPWDEHSVYKSLIEQGVIPEGTKPFTDEVRRFGIAESELDDDWDLDLVSNGQEMWAYYLDYANESTLLADICETNAWSDGETPDYFRTFATAPGVTNYLGAVYNGAEFIEPEARTKFDNADLVQNGSRDLYQSGWDWWSIVRYSYALQEELSEEGISEELSVANKFTHVTYEDYTGSTEEQLIEYHVTKLGHIAEKSLDAIISAHGGLERMKQIIREKSSDTLDVPGFEVPEPVINFTFKYTGNDMRDVIIDAWQTSPFYPERGEQLTASWTMPTAFDSGIGYAKCKVPAKGSLKQGKTRFVAYIDTNGDGKFSSGDTWGTAEATIGYTGADFTIRLGDSNPALPVIKLDGSNAVQTVAIVRTKVNGEYVTPRGAVLRRYENNVNRTFIYPTDYIDEDIDDDYIGLDKHLAFDPIDELDPSEEDLPNVETVTYEIVKIARKVVYDKDEALTISSTNLNHYTYSVEVVDEETGETSNVYHTVDQQINEEFTVHYSITRDIPLEVKGEADSKKSDVTMSFKVPVDRAVTKFWLEIDGTERGGADMRGFLLPNFVSGEVLNGEDPYLDQYTSGRIILDEKWFRQNGLASVWSVGQHTVRVALGNDKFPKKPTTDDEWSAPATFAVAQDAAFTGKLEVKVVHPIEAAETFAGKLTVAAYERADVAEPAAFRIGCDANAVVELDGLRENRDYYIAAWFVKDSADGRENAAERLPYDTWGYVTSLGTKTNGFAARAVKAALVPSVTNLVFLQDTDWNDNGILDRTETIKSVPGVTPSAAPDWDPLDVDSDGIPDVDDDDPVFDDSKKSLEGDVMAYQTKRILCVQIGTMEAETNWVWYAVTNPEGEPTADRLSGADIFIPRGTSASELKSLHTTYLYGRKKSSPFGLGRPVTLAEGRVYGYEWKQVALVHHQVYVENGFNPLTANALIALTNTVNTKKFTSLDKYLVTNYLAAVGALAPDAVMTNWTLSAKRIDFDFDGIPDGWELYTMFGTNAVQELTKTAKDDVINAWVFDDRNLDADDDLCTNLHEYDGGAEPTDPWNAYSLYDFLAKQGDLLPGTERFTDAIARKFGITEATLHDDDDLDLIDNLNEMVAYYRDPAALADLSVTNAWSDGETPDYFRVCGSSYLGEMFNGAEFIEPSVRKAMDIATLVRTGTRDYRVSGWDAWSTARYSILNAEGTINIAGVVSDELMLLIRYWNVIRPGEFTGTTVEEAVNFFHTVWEGVVRLIDDEGNVLIEAKDASVFGPGTIHDADAAQTTTQILAFFGGQKKMEETIALNKKDITADEIVTPEPTINLVLKYAGNGSYNLVLEAYQVNSAYPEYGEQLVAQWTTPVKFDAGVAKVNEIRTPGLGSLKQGPARFVAYIDADGDNALSAGDTFGSTAVSVGYLGADVEIRLGEANPALPVIALDASNAVSTVAFIRSAVNGQPLYNFAKGVFIVQYPNNAAREALYPSEYDSGSYIGIDQTLRSLENIDEVETVTYEVLKLRADEVEKLSVTNLNNYIIVDTNGVSNVVSRAVNDTITFRYSLDRDVASSIVCAGSTMDDFALTFTVPTDSCNTKFWLNLQTNGAENATLFGGAKGYLLDGLADGRKILDKSWFEANGISIPAGPVKFGVVLGNDKFGRPDAVACAMAETVINAGASFDGKIALEVRHPVADDLASRITVAVYKKADLAHPYRVYPNLATDETIELDGLPPNNRYYVAAWYVKDPADGRRAGVRMPYDSWGYLSALGEKSDGFDAVSVVAELEPSVTNLVFLQDTDGNANGILDREEDFKGINGVYSGAADAIYGFDIEGVAETEIFSDAMENDVFAYAEVPFYCVQANVGGLEAWFAVMDLNEEDVSDKVTPGIPRGTALNKLKTLRATYFYDYGASNPKRLALGTNVVFAADSDAKVVDVAVAKPLILVHAQVYSLFGFDARTANGTVDPASWTNTRAFTSIDKAYVTNYLANVCGWAGDLSDYALPIDYVDADEVAGGRGDGISDGWELYVMFGPSGPENGSMKHGPWNFADRLVDVDEDGLDLLHEYDGGHFPTDPWNVDTDGDGIIDSYAQAYNLKGGCAGNDNDGDGLSNYAEYLISEVFQFAMLDPNDPHTDGVTSDYFRKAGDLYFGELFTDHDQMDDATEDVIAGLNRYVYDAHLDADDDGWSNYAEVRAYLASDLVPTEEEVVLVVDGVKTVTTNTVMKRAYEVGEKRPSPTLELTVRYNGKLLPQGAAGTLVVRTSRGSSLTVLDAQYTAADAVSRGLNFVSLRTPDYGYVREGLNRIVAFLDLDGNGEFTAGEPFGIVTDADIGWSTSFIELEVTDGSAIFDRVVVADATSTRNVIFGQDASSVSSNGVIAASDPLSGGAVNHVRIVPYAVRGTLQEGQADEKLAQDKLLVNYVENRIVAEFDVNSAVTPFISENDFIGDDVFDIDWGGLYNNICRDPDVIGAVRDVTCVKYRIVLGDDAYIGPRSNLDYLLTQQVARVLLVDVERRFEPTNGRTTPTVVAPIGIVYSAEPTFKWRLDEDANGSGKFGCSYTAFRIQVADTNGTMVYDSGLNCAPPRDTTGAFVWTAPFCIGSQCTDASGKVHVIEPGEYVWKVSMYNAKFKTDRWSATGTFSMAAGLQQPVVDHGFGSLGVAVKYAGPVAVLATADSIGQPTGIVRVQAFLTPDFSGSPIAEVIATNVAEIVDLTHPTANVVLSGLPLGKTIYVRAYIDSDGDFEKDVFESWGGSDGVVCADVTRPIVGVFIEDADTDDDWLPDAWEFAQYGDLASVNAEVSGELLLTEKLKAALEASSLTAGISTGLAGASLTAFQNGGVAALLVGLDSGSATIDAIREAVEKKVVPGTVKITSITLAEDGSKLTLTVDAAVAESVAGRLLSKIYDFGEASECATVTIKIYEKKTLVHEWELVRTISPVKIDKGVTLLEVPLTLEGINPISSFYKVVIEQ